jgi:hypothetical protein
MLSQVYFNVSLQDIPLVGPAESVRTECLKRTGDTFPFRASVVYNVAPSAPRTVLLTILRRSTFHTPGKSNHGEPHVDSNRMYPVADRRALRGK